MGSRGKISGALSIRAERATKKKAKQGGGQAKRHARLKPPDWLTDAGRVLWPGTVRNLTAAGVTPMAIDADAIGAYCETLAALGKALKTDARLSARLSRDLQAWGNLIGASYASRLRLNVVAPKPAPRTADEKVWAKLKKLS